MDGFLLAFKQKGISSNHVVQQTKRLLSLKKVGHLGTLDPMAEGLLVLAVNRATRFSSFFLESDKRYEAEVSFGTKTDTDDAMGEVIESSSTIPKESDIKQELNKFLGESQQNPPFFSALKHKGKPLYKYAREGEFISKPPRKINIYSINNFSYFNNSCRFLVHCSKGTYIRSIARDLGDNLGSKGHLSALKRVMQGEFDVEKSKIPSELNLEEMVSIESAFQFFKVIRLKEEETKIFSNGGKLETVNQENDYYRIYDSGKKFLGLGSITDNQLALKRLV